MEPSVRYSGALHWRWSQNDHVWRRCGRRSCRWRGINRIVESLHQQRCGPVGAYGRQWIADRLNSLESNLGPENTSLAWQRTSSPTIINPILKSQSLTERLLGKQVYREVKPEYQPWEVQIQWKEHFLKFDHDWGVKEAAHITYRSSNSTLDRCSSSWRV